MKNVMLAEPVLIPLFGVGLLVLVCLLAILSVVVFLIVHFSRKSKTTAPPPDLSAAPPTEILPRKCPQCGAELKPDVSEGLCPACLLQRGIATEGGAPPGTPPFTPPTIPDLAKLFPQLEILELIGKGGMGAVYKARQPALDRFVALKILAPRSGGDLDFAERFTREARALAKLSHPNIVGVYDFGQIQRDTTTPSTSQLSTRNSQPLSYFIMEFVDGPNLRQIEQAGKLSPREALEIIPQICAALQFAHDEGIVHRDIKPENVLLDKKGRVKIADFGLAKILGQEPQDFRLTGARDVVGTPHYMAPEQVEKPQTVDHRADIYSLGVVFYEMLTGELPLGKFQPPSSCSRGMQIDVRLDEVVLHALEKEPARRYQHVSEVKTRLETIAQTPPVAGTGLNTAVFTQAAQAQDYALNIGHCLARGWNLVAHDFWHIVGVAALIGLLQHAAHSTLIGIIVSGPLAGGLWLYFLKKIRGEPANVGTAFSGFSVAFVPLFLGSLVTFLLVLAGFLCFLLPGIYLAVAWAFTLMLIADGGLDFWPAMGLSRKVISKHWWKFLWFFIVLGAIELAGLLMCFIGIFVAAPFALAALAYAYEDIFSPAARAAGNAPPGATVSPRPGGGPGTAIGIMAGAAAAVVFIAILGLLATIAIPNFVRARHQSQQNAARQWTQEGWQLWQAQKLDQAAAKFQQAVQLTPDNAEAWNGLGWATFNAGKPQEAEPAFQKAISLDTNQPGALNGLGQIYLSQGKYKQAEAFLLKAAPQAPAAWYGLARLYLLEGKFDQAEKWAQNIVDSGQADETAKKMLEAAKAKKLDQGLRLLLEPPAAKQSGQAPTLRANTNDAADFTSLLNHDQQTVLAWTDRQFRSFFDTRSFDGWPDEERATLERKLIDSLQGPQSQEYYQAINTLAALRSAQALPALREIAFDRAEKDNRDRWMATRALGIIGDKASVPGMIHLLYHYNSNTRWWAQISLVRLTGTNFTKDWNAWGKWWNDQNGQPPFQPEIIRWWSQQPEPDKLAKSLNESDNEWLDGIQVLTGEQYLQQQLKLAQAGNYWAKFNLWEAYSKGQHEVAKNPAEADKWLSELVKGAYLAKFEPVNGFNPKNPQEMLDEFNGHCQLRSGRDSLGGASFFRTTKQGDKLIGSFLTATPDEFKAAIEKNPNLKLISIEKVTPEMFLAHEAAQQESL